MGRRLGLHRSEAGSEAGHDGAQGGTYQKQVQWEGRVVTRFTINDSAYFCGYQGTMLAQL